MEAAGFSEASVHFNLTIWCYIPKDGNLQFSFTVGTDSSRFHVTVSLQINSRGHRTVSLSEQQYGKPYDSHSYNKCKDSEVAHKILPRCNLAMAVNEAEQAYKPENKKK
jgi:hypothetical protein